VRRLVRQAIRAPIQGHEYKNPVDNKIYIYGTQSVDLLDYMFKGKIDSRHHINITKKEWNRSPWTEVNK